MLALSVNGKNELKKMDLENADYELAASSKKLNVILFI